MLESKYKVGDFVEIVMGTGGDVTGTVTIIEELAGWCPSSSITLPGHNGYWVKPIATGVRDANDVPIKAWYQSEETLRRVEP